MDNLSMMRQEDATMLSEAIKKVNANLMCGQKCQEEKKRKQLKANYEQVQYSIKHSEEELAKAEKKYFQYAFGDAKYNDVLKGQYADKANSVIQGYQQDFNKKSKTIENLEKSCTEKERTINYFIDLINKYKTTNKKNSEKIGKEIDSNNTAHRKVFYEEDRVNNMIFVNKIIRYIMWIIYSIFIIVFFYFKLYKKSLNILLLNVFTVLIFRKLFLFFVYSLIAPYFT